MTPGTCLYKDHKAEDCWVDHLELRAKMQAEKEKEAKDSKKLTKSSNSSNSSDLAEETDGEIMIEYITQFIEGASDQYPY